MSKDRCPVTPAIRFLRSKGIDFNSHTYPYADRGGAGQAAEQLHISAHHVVKTLVMETEDQSPYLVLMHGDRTVSTRRLAQAIGAKKVRPSSPANAKRYTGYRVGGISPFGSRKALPIFVQESILALATIFINGGKRGLLVEINPTVLLKELDAIPVDVDTIDQTVFLTCH